jgi:CheY-specific phosphatase CheX
MSALADSLITQTKEFVKGCTILIGIDGADVDGNPTYSVALAAPGYTQTTLAGQTVAEVSAAVTEFTDWVTEKWATLP